MTLANNDVLPTEILAYGAYVCLRVGRDTRDAIASVAACELAEQFGFRNEFEPGGAHPSEAVAFLRRIDATPGAIADDNLLQADAIIHVASQTAQSVEEFCSQIEQRLGPAVKPLILRGVTRPMSYTENAMHNFAYAHQVTQQPGKVMPNAFLVPMSKTPAWWAKNWLERHTYFLPRYDDDGRMLNQGHALAAAAGIPCLLRRTSYRHRFRARPDCPDIPAYGCPVGTLSNDVVVRVAPLFWAFSTARRFCPAGLYRRTASDTLCGKKRTD